MNIKTKFNIGDKVFWVCKSIKDLTKYEAREITIGIIAIDIDGIYYKESYTEDYAYDESTLFPTRQEAMREVKRLNKKGVTQ